MMKNLVNNILNRMSFKKIISANMIPIKPNDKH